MISVIIPVFNTAQYLPNLIDSIQSQTYRNLEIVFVNDGSTDESGELLETFARHDSRVKVIHQKNGGVSAARNAGLEVVTGEYVTFADSDDTLEPDLYETLLELIKEYQVEISHCSYNRIQNGKVRPVGNTGKVYVQTCQQALQELTCGSLFMGGCCNKLYSRRLFDDVRFDTALKLSEDELVNFQLFSKVETIVYRDACKYNYFDSATSACRNTHMLRKAQDHLEVANRIYHKNCFSELEPMLRRKQLNAQLEYYKALLYESDVDKAELQKASRRIDALRKTGVQFSRKQKWMYRLMRMSPWAFRITYGIYDRIRVIE